jgi:hypothetical protein
MKPYVQYTPNGKLWKAGKTIWSLCAAYNHATSPSRFMTEEEHKRSNIYARAIRNRIRRMDYRYGIHYSEWSNGALWPTATKLGTEVQS